VVTTAEDVVVGGVEVTAVVEVGVLLDVVVVVVVDVVQEARIIEVTRKRVSAIQIVFLFIHFSFSL
jgi:transposase-like protein